MNLLKTLRRSVVPALPLLAVPLLLAAPAGAQTLHGTDPGHDVKTFAITSLSMKPAPAQANADLRGYRVKYAGGSLRVTEKFRTLDHSNPILAVGGTFKLPSGKTHDLIVRARKGNWQGTARLEGRPGCAIRHHIDYANAQAVITVPAKCLGTPRFVRLEYAALTTDSWKNPTYMDVDVAPAKSVLKDRYSARIFPN